MKLDTNTSAYESEMLETGVVTVPFKPLPFSFFMQLRIALLSGPL